MENKIDLTIYPNMDADHIGSVISDAINKLEEDKRNVITINNPEGANDEDVYYTIRAVLELCELKGCSISVRYGPDGLSLCPLNRQSILRSVIAGE
jgi:hypothetical protein